MIKGTIYRLIMRLAHRYNWHYAPPIYPEGDTQLWCKWCGFRQTIKKSNNQIEPTLRSTAHPERYAKSLEVCQCQYLIC